MRLAVLLLIWSLLPLLWQLYTSLQPPKLPWWPGGSGGGGLDPGELPPDPHR
jgi:hypothetical protein